MKTYTTAANARRAARKALGAKAVEGNNGDFEVKELGKKSYAWEPVAKYDPNMEPTEQPAAIEPPATESKEPVAPPAIDWGRVRELKEALPDGDEFAEPPEDASQPEGEEGLSDINFAKAKRDKGAVKRVWDICEENKDLRRKDVIDICVAKGINFYTARTQYQAWFKATKDSNGGNK